MKLYTLGAEIITVSIRVSSIHATRDTFCTLNKESYLRHDLFWQRKQYRIIRILLTLL